MPTQRNVYIYTILLLVASYAWIFYSFIEKQKITVCFSKLVYNIPCPGCGITRACISILKGHYLHALYLNINSFAIVLSLLIVPLIIIYDIICRKKTLAIIIEFAEKELKKKIVIIPFFIIEFIVWIHNIICNI